MCEVESTEVLAELFLRISDVNGVVKNVTCICTRAFITSKNFTSKKETLNISDCDGTVTNVATSESVDVEKFETEASCYFSASHTDNISTDDSARDAIAKSIMPSSDSGADLSERLIDRETWEQFWAKNGEQIIWQSWISTYSDYINQEYLDTCRATSDANDEKQDVAVSKPPTKFPFSETEIQAFEASDSRPATHNLSASNTAERLTDLGWNPLSPPSVFDSISENQENEQLLQKRCSSTVSVTNTLATTDSMTNVTKMTMSSFDIDSHNSSSSFSSFHSSLSSSESDNERDGVTTVMDPDEYWQILWKDHFESKYTEVHDMFVRNCVRKNRRSSVTRRDGVQACDELSCGLKMMEIDARAVDSSATGLAMHGAVVTGDDDDDGVTPDTWHIDHTYIEQAHLLGLPTQFGKEMTKTKRDRKKITRKNDICDSDDSSDAEETTARDTNADGAVSRALKLLCCVWQANDYETISGDVKYHKKNIRAQNRQLGLKAPNKHIYFDDEGNPMEPGDTVPAQRKCSTFTSSDDEVEKVTSRKTLKILKSDETSSSDEQIKTNEFLKAIQAVCEKKTDTLKRASSAELFEENREVGGKRKKRNKKPAIPSVIADNPQLSKYWYNRYKLFSRYDDGIKLDYESWFSVTPESIAEFTAKRCKCDVIVDAFCGAGGNTIQFANYCQKVIAIDIDAKKIEMAKHNATIYGVADKIEFICGDFLQLYDTLKADVVFLSPPWGGPEYLKYDLFDLEKFIQPVPASQLLTTARTITRNVAFFIPRNSNLCQLVTTCSHDERVQFEQNFIDKKLVAYTAYFGDLCN